MRRIFKKGHTPGMPGSTMEIPRNIAVLLHRYDHKFDLYKDELNRMLDWAHSSESNGVDRALIPLYACGGTFDPCETLAQANINLFTFPISVPQRQQQIFQFYPGKHSVIGAFSLMKTAMLRLAEAVRVYQLHWDEQKSNDFKSFVGKAV